MKSSKLVLENKTVNTTFLKFPKLMKDKKGKEDVFVKDGAIAPVAH